MIKPRRVIEMTMTVKERDTKIAAAQAQLTVLDTKIALLFDQLETLKAERNTKQTDLLDLKMAITRRTDREKLADAFKKLRAAGYFARMGLGTTSDTCWNHVPDTDKVAVYSKDEADHAFAIKGTGFHRRGYQVDSTALKSDDLQDILYIGWKGDGQFILDTLLAENLNATWDGNLWSCIFVNPEEVK
jgi:hypothetical protein